MELTKVFFDLPEGEVLQIRDQAVRLIKEGKTLMEVTAGGKTGRRQWAMPPKEMLFEARAALRHINPQRYGKRIRKTYAAFRQRYD